MSFMECRHMLRLSGLSCHFQWAYSLHIHGMASWQEVLLQCCLIIFQCLQDLLPTLVICAFLFPWFMNSDTLYLSVYLTMRKKWTPKKCAFSRGISWWRMKRHQSAVSVVTCLPERVFTQFYFMRLKGWQWWVNSGWDHILTWTA